MPESDETHTCDLCGGPATPGGLPDRDDVETVCPACEDAHDAARAFDYPPAVPPGLDHVPPHGNTTR